MTAVAALAGVALAVPSARMKASARVLLTPTLIVTMGTNTGLILAGTWRTRRPNVERKDVAADIV